MTPEQKEIMAFSQSCGDSFTKKQAIEKFARQYYCNGADHVGNRLGRMVKSNLLIRIKPGVYKVGSGKKNNPSNVDKNQLDLF